MTTGPLHWQLLVRSRALDSQLFVAAVCCARDMASGYVAYGHSMLVGPMGNVLAQAQEQPAIIEGDVFVRQCIEVTSIMREETAAFSQSLPSFPFLLLLLPHLLLPNCCSLHNRHGRISQS
jgi:predicted amidohydrolase